MRYAAGIEYDGGDFHGWQTQSHARNVQDCVEAAFSKVAAEPVAVVCSGRTDAGVHALEQVVHFDARAQRRPSEWRRGANANLPEDVAVHWVKPVDDDFHARFSARRRCYGYVILNRPERSALHRRTATHVHRPLDAGAMRRAAQAVVGEHDFSSFRAAGCQARSPVRRVFSVDTRRAGEFVEIIVCADAFLQQMVRNIAGVLIAVGAGAQPEAWVGEVLARRDRTQGGVTAAGCGLYLLGVEYAARYGIARAFANHAGGERQGGFSIVTGKLRTE